MPAARWRAGIGHARGISHLGAGDAPRIRRGDEAEAVGAIARATDRRLSRSGGSLSGRCERRRAAANYVTAAHTAQQISRLVQALNRLRPDVTHAA